MFHLEMRRSDNDAWDYEAIGDGNDFDTVAESVQAAQSLRSIGPEWEGKYRVFDGQGKVICEV